MYSCSPCDAPKRENHCQILSKPILINAFVFQENLAGRSDGLEDVPSLDEMNSDSGMTKAMVMAIQDDPGMLSNNIDQRCEISFICG